MIWTRRSRAKPNKKRLPLSGITKFDNVDLPRLDEEAMFWTSTKLSLLLGQIFNHKVSDQEVVPVSNKRLDDTDMVWFMLYAFQVRCYSSVIFYCPDGALCMLFEVCSSPGFVLIYLSLHYILTSWGRRKLKNRKQTVNTPSGKRVLRVRNRFCGPLLNPNLGNMTLIRRLKQLLVIMTKFYDARSLSSKLKITKLSL